MMQPSYLQQQAFILIELIIQWEGQLTTGPLMEHFNVSRSTASGMIKKYLQQSPGAIFHNTSAKAYQAGPEFAPRFSHCSLEEYSQFFLGQEKDHHYLSTIATDTPRFFSGLQRKPKPEIVREIIQAIKQQQRLDIAYASLSSPEFEERIISPHTLVFDGYRWHVRSFCEKNQDYRDFVLARINQVFSQEGKAPKQQQHDALWHQPISFAIEPDTRLSDARKRIIALDYGMQASQGRYQKHYQTTAAMLIYWLQYLRIDRYREKALAQQIILSPESQQAISEYLPK